MPPYSARKLEEEMDELKKQLLEQQQVLEKRDGAEESRRDFDQLTGVIEQFMKDSGADSDRVATHLSAIEARIAEAEARIADAEGAVKGCSDNAEGAVKKLADVEVKVEESSKTASGAAAMAAQIEQQVDSARSDVRGELRVGLQRLAEELRGELAAGLEMLAGRLRAEEELTRELTEGLTLRRKEAASLQMEMREQAQEAREAREALRAELARAEVAGAERAEEQSFRVSELKSSLTSALEDACDRQRALVHTQLRELSGNLEEKLLAAQAESRRHVARLQEACAAAAGTPIQQVEWRIEDCLRQLAPVEPEGAARQWLSPPFEAAGVAGLRLELRVRGRRGTRGSGDGDAGAQECSAFLHAPAGLRLECRLFIGNESVDLVRSDDDDDGRCGAEHVGALNKHVSRQDGSLRLRVEILKATREVIVASPDGDSPAGVIVSRHCISHQTPETIDTRARNMVESVSRKLDVLDASRSLAVRRVQWRLELGSMLMQQFAQGKAVSSAPFQACGIAGLQMIFYPRGCQGAKEGFCSFFLACPPGVTIRCWLWAGRWKREARQEPTEKQDLLGRVNFCRLQNCVDTVSEIVELALEIQEAERSTLVGESQEMDCAFDAEEAPASPQPRQAPEVGRVDVSTQKVQHAQGRVPPDQVMQLPSIRTGHGLQPLDGERAPAASEPSPSDGSRAPTARSGPCEESRLSPRPPGTAPGTARCPRARSGAQGQPKALGSPRHKGTPREPRRRAQTSPGGARWPSPGGGGRYREYAGLA